MRRPVSGFSYCCLIGKTTSNYLDGTTLTRSPHVRLRPATSASRLVPATRAFLANFAHYKSQSILSLSHRKLGVVKVPIEPRVNGRSGDSCCTSTLSTVVTKA